MKIIKNKIFFFNYSYMSTHIKDMYYCLLIVKLNS